MEFKYTFLLSILCLLIISSLKAQSPIFEWVTQTGGTHSEAGNAITTDNNGNVYTTGYFHGTADFNPSAATYNLTSVGISDIYIQKLDSNGNFLWVKQMGGTGAENAFSICTDNNGNVYTTGYFQGTADFDPSTGSFNLVSLGNYDIFIHKLDTNGNFLWAKQMGGTNIDHGISITTDSYGNIYTTGFFSNTVDFDPGTGTSNLTALGNSPDTYIQKLDTNGNFLWAKRMGGTGFEYGLSITTDLYDNIITTGFFSDSVDFDPGAGTANFISLGGYDIFIQKLDEGGNFLWAKHMGGSEHDYGHSVKTDIFGNVYTGGTFRNTADFDPGSGSYDLTSAGAHDVYVQKLNSNGNFLWAKSMGGTDNDYVSSIATDISQNLYLTGYFEGTPDFDPDSGITTLYSAGDYDIFIQKLNINGNLNWVRQMGAYGFDAGNSLVIDANGNIYTTGCFSGMVDFDPEPGTHFLTGFGSEDVFIQKLSQCTESSGTDIIIACDSYTWINGITYTNSNNTATDTLINSGGCDSIVTLDLTINNVSDISTSVSGTTITANNTFATYQWLDCDNNHQSIIGETSQSFTAIQNGNYAVELSENGCVDTTSCIPITNVGVEALYNDFKIYPNPSTGIIKISTSFPQHILRLYSLDQRLINEWKLNKNVSKIDLNINPGIYILEISNNFGGKNIQKIVIQ